jgi:S-formylglutathione hydrolase FrmB
MGGHGALIMALKNPEIRQRVGICADCEPNAGAVGAESLYTIWVKMPKNGRNGIAVR